MQAVHKDLQGAAHMVDILYVCKQQLHISELQQMYYILHRFYIINQLCE